MNFVCPHASTCGVSKEGCPHVKEHEHTWQCASPACGRVAPRSAACVEVKQPEPESEKTTESEVVAAAPVASVEVSEVVPETIIVAPTIANHIVIDKIEVKFKDIV
jgi:hypothetical protein